MYFDPLDLDLLGLKTETAVAQPASSPEQCLRHNRATGKAICYTNSNENIRCCTCRTIACRRSNIAPLLRLKQPCCRPKVKRLLPLQPRL